MEKKNISLLEFEGNANIGLYFFVNDKFCILGNNIEEEKLKEIEKNLNVPVYKASILGTDLIGVFVTGNNNYLLIPKCYDYEVKIFEKIAKNHDIKLETIDNNLNTFGNNICFGKNQIFINSDYNENFINKLKKITKYNITKINHHEFNSAGAICTYINDKYFVSQELDEDYFKEVLDEIGGVGTVNSGSNFVSSGIVGNKFGILIGSLSSTIEIQNIVESLDMLE